MKRLISEEEICDCRNTNSIFNLNKYVPVEVAGEKIKNIAIEFYNWMQINHSTTMSKIYEVDGSAKIYSTDDLFEKFLSTRK